MAARTGTNGTGKLASGASGSLDNALGPGVQRPRQKGKATGGDYPLANYSNFERQQNGAPKTSTSESTKVVEDLTLPSNGELPTPITMMDLRPHIREDDELSFSSAVTPSVISSDHPLKDPRCEHCRGRHMSYSPLVKCSFCRRHYHSHCHKEPPIPDREARYICVQSNTDLPFRLIPLGFPGNAAIASKRHKRLDGFLPKTPPCPRTLLNLLNWLFHERTTNQTSTEKTAC